MAGYRKKPVLVQLETQARLTLALLPLVAALPFLSDELLVRMFGQSMAILNWIPPAPWETLPELQVSKPPLRTKEEQRAYWRERQREHRKQKRKP